MKGTPPDKENNLNIRKINDYNGLNHIKYVSICELTTALKTNKQTNSLLTFGGSQRKNSLFWKVEIMQKNYTYVPPTFLCVPHLSVTS